MTSARKKWVDKISDKLSISDNQPHDPMTQIAHDASKAIPDGYHAIIMVTDPDSDQNGVAVTGYTVDAGLPDAEARRSVVRQAVADAVVHMDAMIRSVDPDWRERLNN